MPSPVFNAIQEHLALERDIGGYEAAELRTSWIESAYQEVAALLKTKAQQIAFVENATVAYSQALSCIPFSPGQTLLTTNNDYVSNQLMFLALRKRFGIQVVRVPDRTTGEVDLDAMEQLIKHHRPRLVAVTHMPTNSGLVQPIEAIGKLCSPFETLYLVDACQTTGQLPLKVSDIGCDFLTATSRKFLRGPRGCGFLYVSERVLQDGLEPLFIDLGGARWTDPNQYQQDASARRFENWEFAYALVLGTAAAANYATTLGLDWIQERSLSLAARLRQELSALPRVNVLDRGSRLGAIVTAHIESLDSGHLMQTLKAQKINTSLSIREYAVIDFSNKDVDWALRISPHYYNTPSEVDLVVETIADLLVSRP